MRSLTVGNLFLFLFLGMLKILFLSRSLFVMFILAKNFLAPLGLTEPAVIPSYVSSFVETEMLFSVFSCNIFPFSG